MHLIASKNGSNEDVPFEAQIPIRIVEHFGGHTSNGCGHMQAMSALIASHMIM